VDTYSIPQLQVNGKYNTVAQLLVSLQILHVLKSLQVKN